MDGKEKAARDGVPQVALEAICEVQPISFQHCLKAVAYRLIWWLFAVGLA